MSRTLLSVRNLVAIGSVGALFGIFGSGCASGGQAGTTTTTGGAAGSTGTGGSQEAGGGTGGTAGFVGTGGGGTEGGPTEGGAGDSGVEGGGAAGTDGGGGAAGSGQDGGGSGGASTDGGTCSCSPAVCAKPEICNGLDDNCNGLIDEPPVQGTGQPCTVAGKQGVCAAGTTQCINGTIQCISNKQPSAEICDGLDNNCNGTVDEGNPGGGLPCDTGKLGVCKAGTTECTGGKIVCLENVGSSPEVCNGLDDNCNGIVDDNPTDVGGTCAVTNPPNLQGPCAVGTWECKNGQRVCVQTTTPQTEVCDNKDDNCNGIVDDPILLNGNACQVSGQQGVCQAGKTLCQQGKSTCTQTVQPSQEICDGLDDNCDGLADNGNATTMCELKCNAVNPPDLSALHVTSMACTSGACSITGCSPGWYNSDGNYCTGCNTQQCAQTPVLSTCGSGGGATVVLVPTSGATVQENGTILTLNGQVWYQVEFKQPSAGSGFNPTIALTQGSSEYHMNVQSSCGTPATCQNGETGTNVTTWEENYTYSPACGTPPEVPCTDQLTTGTLWVEVQRASISTLCDSFTLSIHQ